MDAEPPWPPWWYCASRAARLGVYEYDDREDASLKSPLLRLAQNYRHLVGWLHVVAVGVGL